MEGGAKSHRQLRVTAQTSSGGPNSLPGAHLTKEVGGRVWKVCEGSGASIANLAKLGSRDPAA
jgi:hypothetical protein